MALESLKIREEMGDSTEVSYSLITLADIEAQNKNYVDAIKHAQRALQMGKKMGKLSHVWDAYISLGETYRLKGDYKNAAEHFREVLKLSDTLVNSRVFTVIHEMEAKYETNKKEAQISVLNSQKKIQELELYRQEANISRQRWIMIFGLLVILAMVAVSIIIYRGYRQKKKSNEKIQTAYSIIEEKQKEILDSIRYAKRIQNFLLPSEKYITKHLNKLKKK